MQNDGEDVTLKTKLTTAKITDTLIDEQPLAIFAINKVLQPKELFKGEAEAPAPAPEPAAADAPAPAKKKGKKKKAADAPADASDAPADSPDDAADVTADDSNGAVKANGGRYGGVVALALGLVFGLPLVL